MLFSSVDADGNSLALIDYPANPTSGQLGLPGQIPTLPNQYGFINYVTGQFQITFPTAPACTDIAAASSLSPT